MSKLFYISPMRLNAAIAETVISGHHIKIGEYTYVRLTRAPRGKRIIRKLSNLENSERIVIYS